MYIYTDEQVNSYAVGKKYAVGTILWASDKPLDEDAFRSGAKSNAAIDFLRWQDIGLELVKGKGRIPPDELHNHVVKPGKGISLFIKRMLPEGMTYLGSIPDAKKKALKESFDPVIEKFWWQIESGQPLPTGLQLIFDGEPPGHCTLTTTREISVHEFLGLVSLIKFSSAGSDYYGIAK